MKPRLPGSPCPTAPLLRRVLVALLALFAGPLVAQDYAAIEADLAGGRYGPVKTLLVQRDGQLVYEGYFRGASREQRQLLNSVTKSVGVTLVGIAVRRGLLRLDETLGELLPDMDWNSPELAPKRDMPLRDLLAMRHGLAWDEWTHGWTDPRNTAAQMFASDDWYRFTLSRPLDGAPGSKFTYSTGASTLMSAVLRARTGRLPQELMQEWLVEPLGLSGFHWELWGPGGPGTGQRVFPYGEAPLGVGLWLRARDLMAIGQLHLQGGVFQGQRLLDPEWIETVWQTRSDATTDAYFAQSTEDYGYGLQWWYLGVVDTRGREHRCWFADGAGRQYLVLCPALKLAVVSTGDSYSRNTPGLFTLLRESLLPALPHPIDATLSGFWFEPQTSGQGIAIEVIESASTVALAWYSFASGQPEWFVASGAVVDDRVRFDQVMRARGGDFRVPGGVMLEPAGSAALEWIDCRSARLDYDFDVGSGSYPLSRVSGACAGSDAAR